MELLARGNSNWDYYYDEERNVEYPPWTCMNDKELDVIMASFSQGVNLNAI